MSFIETPRFPDDISYGSRGGPVFKTAIARMDSGHEQRSVQWEYPLHEYDVSYGVRTDEAVYSLRNFFMGVQGAAYGFRYKDWSDYKSCSIASTRTAFDCSVATGTASTTVFQLKKTYVNGSLQLDRPIKKPVSATVSVAFNGTEMPASQFTVAYASGTFTLYDTSAVITNVTQASAPTVTTAASHGLATGVYIYITSVAGMIELNNLWHRVQVTGAAQFKLSNVNSTRYGEYVRGGRLNTLPVGQEITAGFEFDVPCRFESDIFVNTIEAYNMNNVEARVIELRKAT